MAEVDGGDAAGIADGLPAERRERRANVAICHLECVAGVVEERVLPCGWVGQRRHPVYGVVDVAGGVGGAPGVVEWESFSLSTRQGILQWIGSAKRPGTRAKRIQETATMVARGEKANQWVRNP